MRLTSGAGVFKLGDMDRAIRAALVRYIDAAGSQRKASLTLHVSQAHISDVLTGRRNPGLKIIAALGLKRVVQYEAR